MEQVLIFAITVLGDYLGILTGLVVAFYASLIVFALAPNIFRRKE